MVPLRLRIVSVSRLAVVCAILRVADTASTGLVASDGAKIEACTLSSEVEANARGSPVARGVGAGQLPRLFAVDVLDILIAGELMLLVLRLSVTSPKR
jgi:hypothetical protein